MSKINAHGIKEIDDFLKRRHKNGPDFEYPLNAWANEAETNGNLVLKGYASNDGQGHVLQLSKSSFDNNVAS